MPCFPAELANPFPAYSRYFDKTKPTATPPPLYFIVIKYTENNFKFLHFCHQITSRIVTRVRSAQEEIWKDFSDAQQL